MYDIGELRLRADGSELVSPAIQQVLDQCGASGGGIVRFPAGTYKVGGMELRDNTRIVLEPGCVLLGSPDLADYPLHSTVDD